MFENSNMLDENDIEIKSIIKSSFLDWDGKIVTTIYLPKCNFRCPFCHNWELIEHPERFETLAITELDRHLRANTDFIDGVCITGGEPSLYSGLPKFLEHLRELGLSIKLDTNGTNPDLLNELLNENKLDFIAMDIKGPLDERYHKLAGTKVDLEKLKESIRIIMDSMKDYEFRTTVVPTLLEQQDLQDIIGDIKGAKKYAIQQFVPEHARDEHLRGIKPYPKKTLKSFCEMSKNQIEKVITRGLK